MLKWGGGGLIAERNGNLKNANNIFTYIRIKKNYLRKAVNITLTYAIFSIKMCEICNISLCDKLCINIILHVLVALIHITNRCFCIQSNIFYVSDYGSLHKSF